MEIRRLLVVVAHADDEIIGPGGFVAKCVDDGAIASVLIMSNGKIGTYTKEYIDDRNGWISAATSIIGYRNVYMADNPTVASDTVPLRKFVDDIAGVIEGEFPDTILTHHYGDLNIDHRTVHDAVVTAARPIRSAAYKVSRIITFETHSSTEWNVQLPATVFIPNMYVDITGTIDRKLEAMRQYVGELKSGTHPRSIRHLRNAAAMYGTQVGVDYAERFCIERVLV